MRPPIGKPKKRTTVYLEADLHMELKLKAARTGHKVSDIINAMLAESLATKVEQPRPQDQIKEILKALRDADKKGGELTGNQ